MKREFNPSLRFSSMLRVAMVKKKCLENETFSRSVKSQGISFLVRKIFEKMKKKSGNFFSKNLIVNRLLKFIFSINCTRLIFRNISFLIFLV